jgi:hypothetical protein
VGITRQRFRFKVYDYLHRGVGYKRKAKKKAQLAALKGKSIAKKVAEVEDEKEEREVEEKETKPLSPRKATLRKRVREEDVAPGSAKKPRIVPRNSCTISYLPYSLILFSRTLYS